MGNHFSRVAALALALAVSISAGRAHAQPITDAEIPPALRPWVPWVLAEEETYGCTRLESAAAADRSEGPLCVWPGELRIELTEHGARFSISVSADRRYALGLPGGAHAWPTELRVDGRPAPIASDDDAPIVFVEAGSHRVDGEITWTDAPDTLLVPEDVARIVVVDHGATRAATRGTSGEIWLRAADDEDEPADDDVETAPEPEAVHFEVHRRLSDGAPMELVTRITVRAAGRARELRLGDVLPDGVVPLEVSAEIPTRLDETGALTLQLRAGTFQVEIRALVPSPEAHLSRPELDDPWPDQEVWIWVPNEAFRQVEIAGASGIDPERTSLPSDWRSYSAYIVDARTELSLETARRGEPSPPPNELELERTIWLDADGNGATVQDYLSLEMHSGFRVDLTEGELGRVTIDSRDMLITAAEEGGRPGVEVRDIDGRVDAEWRVDGPLSSLLAVGWSEDAQSTSTSLRVPPGWALLHAGGVDRIGGAWSEEWTLLGFFALLLIAIVVGRVIGWQWGLVAFASVGLAYHEDGAPRWIWLILAVTLALHRALGTRPAVQWVRRAYVVLLIFATAVAVPFAGAQVRLALFPLLARDTDMSSYEAMEEETPAWLEEPEYDSDDQEGGTGRRHRDEEGSMGEESAQKSTSRYGIEAPEEPTPEMARDANWLDQNAVVSTGYGIPTWEWRHYALVIDGPVGREQRISLLLAPPWVTRLGSLLSGALALALLLASIRARPRLVTTGNEPDAKESTATAAAALLLLALAWPSGAMAQPSAPAGPVPSSEMLSALRERLLWTDDCGEFCAEASAMTITVTGDRLAIDIDLGVRVVAAYPLPGPSDTWTPDRVTIDGAPASGLARLHSGFVHVRVPVGVHVLHAEGTLAGRDRVTLALGRLPRSLSLALVDWETNGTDTEERVPDSIQLSRAVSAAPVTDPAVPADPTAEGSDMTASEPPAELPVWLEVQRRLDIGVRWTITSTATRRSPVGRATVVRIPLLPGESVTDSTVTAEDGSAVVNLGQHDSQVSWTSVIEASGDIVLAAPASGHISEVWTIACSPLWHCNATGLAPTESAADGRWEPRFDPWPGETLTVTMTRPLATSGGPSTTIDSAHLRVEPGARLSSSTLELSVRTSVTAPLAVTLPLDAEIRTLTVDGTARAIQREDGTLTLALQPGSHSVRIEWQDPSGWSTFLTTPAVRVGGAAVNLSLDVAVTDDRWLLWIGGPSWGPSVVLWPYLVLVLLVALGLSRRRELMPKPHEWALLGLGLTQVPVVVALFVAGWFFVLAWRARDPIPSALGFNARQVLLGAYTVFAAAALALAIREGLLGEPEMSIEGPGTSLWNLHFYADRTEGVLPTALVVSVPMVVYRVAMFAWAAWLAVALVRWGRGAWKTFADGGLWRSDKPSARVTPLPAFLTPGAAAPAAPAVAAPPAPAAAQPPTPAAPEGEGEGEGKAESEADDDEPPAG